MPRDFQPIGGFKNQPINAVRIEDDGTSHNVLKDGTTQQIGVDRWGKHSPTWTLQEMEALVASGKWEEISQQQATPEPAPPTTRVDGTVGKTRADESPANA